MENKHGRFVFMPLSVKSSNMAMEDEMMINYEEGELYIRKDNDNILIASSKVTEHMYDNSNPHKVTKEQIGLGNVTNVEPIPYDTFRDHIEDTNNPHSITKEMVGLGNVKNYGIAKIEDIVDGRHDKYVTPKVFLDYLDEHGIGVGGEDEPKPPIVNEGTLSFVVTPIDAIISVAVDGSWVRGSTHTLPYGIYQYRIERQGYETKTEVATLNMNMVVIRETLNEKAPVVGRLTILAMPEEAKVEIEVGGKWYENYIMDIPYDRYRYRISLEGYESLENIVRVDKSVVTVSHILKEIEIPGGDPDPETPPIVDDTDPGQIGRDEIYIMKHNQFSDIIIERVDGSNINMKLIKNEGILTSHKPGELYRLTLIPADIKYKIAFLYINTDTTGKVIEVDLVEEEMANFTFKVAESSMDKIIGYTVKIKSNISSVGDESIRYIDRTIQATVTEIKEISLPKSLYNISIAVQFISGHIHNMTSARTEYLQDIDFLITINSFIKTKIVGMDSVSGKVGLFTDTPVCRFTTMVIPRRPEAIVEKSNNKKYVYMPIDSNLYIIISEVGKIPRMVTLSDIDKDTVIDISKI